MSENKKEKDTLNLTKSEKEELIELREENEFLRASLAYEKKLKALIQEREQKQGKDKSNNEIKAEVSFNQIENLA